MTLPGTGLPPAAVVFTGRDGAAETLRAALMPGDPAVSAVAGPAVSAVVGPAGVGKTELVLQTAHRALADGWFPGGVLFADLSGHDAGRRRSAGDVLVEWLVATGVPGEHIPSDVADRTRLWRDVLQAYTNPGRRLLLIIDNADGEDQVRPLLPGDDRIPVLITSRRTLDLDARGHHLDDLGPGAAVALLAAVVSARRGSTDPRLRDTARSGLTELAEVCAGLPLTLRIVAALLADRPHLQPEILARRLRDSRRPAAPAGGQAAPSDGPAAPAGGQAAPSGGQAAVRAAFDVSYQNLSDAPARLFRLLPIDPGPDLATLSAAHLADMPEHRVTALLADLHRAHLITEPAPGRWALHDLLRDYATERLAEVDGVAGAARAAHRLYGFYRDMTGAAAGELLAAGSLDAPEPAGSAAPNRPAAPGETGASDGLDASDRPALERFGSFGRPAAPDRHAALAWLDAELANLVAAARTGPGRGLGATTVDLAFSLAGHLTLRRRFTEAVAVTTRALDVLRTTGEDPAREGAAWDMLGAAQCELGRFDEAEQSWQRAAAVFGNCGDTHHAEAVRSRLDVLAKRRE
ncbi:NB-ARC domain-containing protein [Actinoplanes sp. DH11]|uniref:NB-ARC domain-containing protein n=1 Tax=Actinoplanes sp. DH11 TaxID=2857011 RepID=UPI001E64D1C9|nr:NB-ARC domain-containing protein [Actinoplanes sp. DH11]